MKYPKMFLIGIISVMICFSSSISYAVGVQPLVFNLAARPGDTIPFQLKIIPSKQPEIINLTLFQAKQLLNGDYAYETADPAVFPVVKWISFPSQIISKPGEVVEVNGQIKVPLDAGGTYTSVIMVEPPEPEKKEGVVFAVRYAVRFHIRVDRAGLRPGAKIIDFDMVKGDNGEPLIKAQAKNISPVDFMTSATVTIRDSRRKLLERMEIKPELGWNFKLGEFLVLPESELLYYGSPKEALPPGEYEIRLFYRYGNSGQILAAKTKTVRAGDYTYPAAKLKAVRITPLDLAFSGRPGTSSLKAVKFENRSDKPVNIVIEASDIGPDYYYSIKSNCDIEFKGEDNFILEPGRIATKVITVKFPKDAPVQGNYGIMKIKVYSTTERPILLEESVIDLSAAVLGKYTRTAEATSLTGDRAGNKYVLSAVIKNTGNIKITPNAILIIRDLKDKLVANVNLAAEGDVAASVLPAKLLTLTGEAENLKPGAYKAVIKILEEQVELGTSNLNLNLK